MVRAHAFVVHGLKVLVDVCLLVLQFFPFKKVTFNIVIDQVQVVQGPVKSLSNSFNPWKDFSIYSCTL